MRYGIKKQPPRYYGDVISFSNHYFLKLQVQQDGKIMFPDYLTLMARRMSDPGLQEETIMESFAVFDKDRNGSVDVAELKHVLGKMGEFMEAKEVEKIIAAFGEVDGDGKIKYADFVKNINDQFGILM
jgi:Ca2+-binding EF-hand superfamily protein